MSKPVRCALCDRWPIDLEEEPPNLPRMGWRKATDGKKVVWVCRDCAQGLEEQP